MGGGGGGREKKKALNLLGRFVSTRSKTNSNVSHSQLNRICTYRN